MKDFNGEPLYVGDAVATTRQGYGDMVLMYIYGFTPQKVKLSENKIFNEDDYWNCYKFPSQISKVIQ